VRAEGPWRVVAFYSEPYFRAPASFGDLPLLPAHRYDLDDPDLARCEPQARAGRSSEWKPTDEERAAWINRNRHNREFIGLGPYQLVSFEGDRIRARRFERYFAPERAGRLEELEWLFVREDRMAIEALRNGELDLFARLSTEDWFGETTQSAAFTARAVKQHAPSAAYWFVAWNLRLPKLADIRVRRAIAQAFDFEAFRQSAYRGLATQVTGHGVPGLKGYDETLPSYPLDRAAARTLLAEAGWIDRDGDRVLDKDGQRFTLQLLSNAGNSINALFVAALQNDLAQVGIEVRGELIEFGAMRERSLNRDFEGYVSAWALASESDPEKQFHSRSAAQPKSPNFPGLADPQVDRLIESAQAELDPERRAQLWKQLQRRLYELQPYLWGFTAPRKFAISKDLLGVEMVRADPNYVARRWYRAAGR
jgi:peptide/nickel transport system substrate-binding protein